MSLIYSESEKQPDASRSAFGKPAADPPERKRTSAPTWLRNLFVDAALPSVAVQLLERLWHTPAPTAFAIASVFPAGSIIGACRSFGARPA